MSGQAVQADPASRPAFILWSAVAASMALLLFGLNRGFDLTDESYYLAWIYDPARFDASIHPFGLPLHLLYGLLGQSIVLMRLCSLALLLATGSLLGKALGQFYREWLDQGFRCRLVPFGALASLAYYACWVMTPNYNLLADASGAMIFTGTLVWVVDDRDDRVVSWLDGSASLLVGFGGCLAFFAKPTFAALCAVAVAVVLGLGMRRHRTRPVVRAATIALSCVVPLLLIVWMTVGLGAFLSSIRIGTAVLNYGNSLTSLPGKTLREFYYGSPLLAINMTGFGLIWAWSRNRRDDDAPAPVLARAVMVVLGLDLLFLTWNILFGIHIQARPWVQLGLPGICLVLGVLSLGFVTIRPPYPTFHQLLPVLVLVMMPFAIAFGTANSLLLQTGMSLFAILLALVVAARLLLNRRAARVIEIAATVFVPAMLFWSSWHPYGLPRSLYAQQQSIELPFTSSTLRVDSETHRYVTGLLELAHAQALDDRTPIIDLSGGGPGTALILNDRAPFYPWLVATFEHSALIADRAWQSMDERRQNAAWLVGPIHPHFSQTQVAQHFKNCENEYRLVGKLPMVFWSQIKTVGIWRPVHSSSQAGCNRIRSNAQR